MLNCSYKFTQLLPLLVLTEDKGLFGLPVDAENVLFDLVEESWHLVSENFLRGVRLLTLHNFVVVIERVNILEELATKSAKDDDLVFVQLVRALALTDRKVLLSLDLLPGMRLIARVVLVEALN